MNPQDASRRRFLLSSGSLAGATLLRPLAPGLVAIAQAACSARDQGAPFAVLGEDEARDIAAIAARILPTTDTPGATEAGVIYFIDRALGAELSDRVGTARRGLAEFNEALAGAHGATRFDELDEGARDAFLATVDTTPFFNLVREMTVLGFFAMQKYGGNRDNIGWQLVGFEGHHGPWTYPFGYYDAEVHGETSDGK